MGSVELRMFANGLSRKRMSEKSFLFELKENPEDWEALVETWSSYAAPERLGQKVFRRLIQACKTPRQFSLLMKSFQSFYHAHPHQRPEVFFLQCVDDSPYPLEEWIVAVEVFFEWLHQRERGSDLRTMMGYLNCCIENVDAVTTRPPLHQVLQEMLDRHGFEGA